MYIFGISTYFKTNFQVGKLERLYLVLVKYKSGDVLIISTLKVTNSMLKYIYVFIFNTAVQIKQVKTIFTLNCIFSKAYILYNIYFLSHYKHFFTLIL